jgi:hypothetical protein
MRKRMCSACLSFLILIFSSTLLNAQQAEKYSRVKVFTNPAQFKILQQKGIALDEIAERTNNYIVGDFSATEISIIKETKMRIQIITDDLAADFVKRNAAVKPQDLADARTGGTPTGFNYGTMGGYLTFNEIVAELDEMKSLYPNLITTKASIGTTAEGRSIWMVKISDNPDTDETLEEGVLYTGLHHAREPMSMMNLIYYMWYILGAYNTNPEMACLINNRELYFIPCANPDGYVYNQTTNPSGGGFWRKNRRNNGDGTYGVDLNRNYEYQWGYDNTGSSPTTNSETYRGPSAGSEPEVVAIRNFVNATQLSFALNNHSYANKLLKPFDYNNSNTPIETHYNKVAELLTYENSYLYGKSFDLLGYYANGTTIDWLYGAKNIISFTPEIGSEIDGFWPTQDKIIPSSEGNLDLHISAAWASGRYIRPSIANNTYVSGFSYNLPVLVTNYSNTIGTTETVQLSFSDSRIQSYDNSVISANGLGADATITVNKNVTFNSNATAGPVTGNFVITNSEGCTYSLPFTFQYSPDGCFPISSSWTATDIGSPGLTGSSCFQTGTYTVKGSGTGLQTTSDKYHYMRLATTRSVYEIRAQVLSVQNTGTNARAGITISESFAAGSRRVTLLINPANNSIQFQARSSTNGSVSTTNVNNQGTVPKWLRIVKSSGNNWQAYYSTNGTSWTYINKYKVTLPTNLYAGLAVTSGSSSSLHTATFNNLTVFYTGGTVTRSAGNTLLDAEADTKPEKFSFFPNPSNGVLEVRMPVSNNKQTVTVFDINGRMILTENMTSNYKRFDVSNLSNGLYFIRYKDGIKEEYGKFIIRK